MNKTSSEKIACEEENGLHGIFLHQHFPRQVLFDCLFKATKKLLKHLSWIRPLWLQLCPCGGYKVESSWSSFSRCCNASHHNRVSARNFSPAANYSIILLARWEWSSNRSAVPLPRSLITRVKQKASLFGDTMKKVFFLFASRLSTRKSNRVKILGWKKTVSCQLKKKRQHKQTNKQTQPTVTSI